MPSIFQAEGKKPDGNGDANAMAPQAPSGGKNPQAPPKQQNATGGNPDTGVDTNPPAQNQPQS
ncbi:hypothetical protein AA313_de0201289 [Arthrobotrys entomopaga]|nr:hypothetical protein AA313_de0201289 [Arthrobotrys entomopaga]